MIDRAAISRVAQPALMQAGVATTQGRVPGPQE
jgi:hypothetical protein